MGVILSILTPVFALILLGFLAAKFRYLPDNASKVLAEFGFKVAMPALLFRAMLGIEPAHASPFLLWAAFLSAMLVTWIAASVIVPLILRRPMSDAPAIAMGSTFGNTVMLGIPIGLVALGPDAATPMALMVAAHAPLLWIIATLQQEITSRDAGGSILHSLGGVVWDLIRNPIIMSLAVGALGYLVGLKLDPVSTRLLNLLGQAAVPTALFALGMTLAAFRLSGRTSTLIVICTLKLLFYPLVAWFIVTAIIDLPPIWAKSVILFSALPVGANAYLFAARYDRAVGSTSAAIAVSSLLSLFTLTITLALMNGSLNPQMLIGEWLN